MKRWHAVPALVAGAAVLLAIQIGTFRSAAVDDAYISFRYARNLWRGHGLVYNPGEPAVEGYSNFLWTVLQSPGTGLSGDPIVFARLLSLGFLALEIALFVALARRVAPGRTRLHALGVLFLAADPAFVCWHLAGLEAPLQATLLLLVLHVAAKPPHPTRPAWVEVAGGALAWAALAVSRIDAPLLAAACAVALASAGGRGALRASARAWIGAAILYAAYTAWRVHTYGDLLPNTFHAKVAGLRWQSGVVSVWDSVRTHPWSLGLPAAGVWVRRIEAHEHRAVAAAAAAVVAAQAALVVLAGGDWMPLDRFFAPVVPLGLLAGIAAAAARWRDRPPARPGVVFAAACAAACLGLVLFHAGSAPVQVAIHTQNVRNGKALGLSLARAGAGAAVVANGTAGAAPYFSDLRTLDTSGLNDRHIARTPPVEGLGFAPGHAKGDGDYVLSREPDVVVFVGGRSSFPGTYVGDAQMAFDPRLHAHYEAFGFEAPRPVEQRRFLRAPAALSSRLAFLGDMHPVPSRLGVVLETSRVLPLRVLRRTPVTEDSPAVRCAFLEIEAAARDADWSRAHRLVLQHASTIEAAELGGVVEPLAMLYGLRSGDADAAREHLQRALADRGPFAPLLRIWLASRPELRSLAVAARPLGSR